MPKHLLEQQHIITNYSGIMEALQSFWVW